LSSFAEVHLLDGPTIVFVDSEKSAFHVMHCADPFSASQELEDSDDENEKMDIELGSNPWQTFDISIPVCSFVYFGLSFFVLTRMTNVRLFVFYFSRSARNSKTRFRVSQMVKFWLC
jgi:hypothetical protein